MTLTLEQLQRLHLEDGIISTDELEPEFETGFDPSADRQLRKDVRAALLSIEAPRIVDAVMTKVGRTTLPVGDSIREETPAFDGFSSSVMGQIGHENSVAEGFPDALVAEAGEFQSVWPQVAEAIGVESGAPLGGLIREAIVSESGFQERGWAAGSSRPWLVPATAGVLIAAAAALLIWVGTTSPAVQDVAEKIASGPVDIEALEVGAANAVQVLQRGEDEPTIILIEQKPDGQEATE